MMRRLAGATSKLELYVHEMFPAITRQFQHGTGLFSSVKKDFWRNFPGAGHIEAVDVIDGFAVTVIELERFPLQRNFGREA